jgi:hypothetical protein
LSLKKNKSFCGGDPTCLKTQLKNWAPAFGTGSPSGLGQGLGLPRPCAALRRVRAASCSSTTSSRPWRVEQLPVRKPTSVTPIELLHSPHGTPFVKMILKNCSPRVRPTDVGSLPQPVPGRTQEGVAEDTAGQRPRRLERGGYLPHQNHFLILICIN